MNLFRFLSSYLKFFIIISALFVTPVFSQPPQWQHGFGSAVGTDIEAMRMKALNNARADALAKVGVTVTTGDTRLLSETENAFTDFYAKFAESSTKGIILEEKIIREGDLKKIEGTAYKIEIEIDAKVALQQGESDPAFSVKCVSSNQIVKEGEPFTLTVTSTKSGYLTLFNVYQDSLSVMFPNSIDKVNKIEAGKPFHFPPHNAYQLEMALPAGRSTSTELFIAVVTTENIPFPNFEQIKFTNGAISLRSEQLTLFAQWLYKIPLNSRSADQIPMTVN